MSKEFIQKGYNSKSLREAAEQESQLSYFTKSKLQEKVLTDEYLRQWADRKYQGNDYFLNFVKSVFKPENAINFSKFLRYPLPSAKLVNNKIKPQLNRVFTSENADFSYSVLNVSSSEIKDTLQNSKFQNELFERILFKHNSILIDDVAASQANEPYRYFVDIEDVVSLTYNKNGITRIAYKAIKEGQVVTIYIDREVYMVYDKDLNLLSESPHDLERCPATFISKNPLFGDYIVKESIFSYVREEMEEYVFLKTLQRMVEPNGAIPVVTKIEVTQEETPGEYMEPDGDIMIGSQRPSIYGDNPKTGTGDLQAGTIHEVPLSAIVDEEGKLNVDAVKNFLNFFYIPTEALNYLNNRIGEKENSIISTIIGTIDTSNEESKNEMQIEKSIIVLENTLIYLAEALNEVRQRSDYNQLALKYGREKVQDVFIFYGTDFFLESQSKLFTDLEKAPNPIERKSILVRINQNKYKSNHDKMVRQKLLYDLLPYTTDKDFEIARSYEIDPVTVQMQLRFNYWIGSFEALYGDIVGFYEGLDGELSERLTILNNLLKEIITNNINQ